jgi:hypothetical protein
MIMSRVVDETCTMPPAVARTNKIISQAPLEKPTPHSGEEGAVQDTRTLSRGAALRKKVEFGWLCANSIRPPIADERPAAPLNRDGL